MEKQKTTHVPKDITLSVKHSVYNVMVWACMAASESGALVYSDETLD